MKLLLVRVAYDQATQERSVVLRNDEGASATFPTRVFCKGLVPMQEYDCTFVGGVVVFMRPLFKKDAEADVLAQFKKGGNKRG